MSPRSSQQFSLVNLFKEPVFSLTFSTEVMLVFDTEELCSFLLRIKFLVPEILVMEMLGLLSLLY